MKIKESFAGQKGFTVLELAIAAGLTMLFAASFYTAFYAMHTEMWRNKNYFDTNTSAKNMLDRISKDVKETLRILPSHGGYSTDDSTLILRLPSIDADGVPTSITSEFDIVTYRLNPSNTKQLLRSVDVNAASVRDGGVSTSNAVVGMPVGVIRFFHQGAGLSTFSAAQLGGIRLITIDVTAQASALSVNQTSQASADVNLMTGTLT